MSESFGWVANAILIVGTILVGRKWRHAFLLTALGNAIWFIIGWQTHAWALVFLCLAFVSLSLYNWLLWWKPDRQVIERDGSLYLTRWVLWGTRYGPGHKLFLLRRRPGFA